MLGLGSPKDVVEPDELTDFTHLRQQQTDLLHFLQRQKRVADRVLEKHVQQNLEQEPGRVRQRGSQADQAPLSEQDQAQEQAGTQSLTHATAFA